MKSIYSAKRLILFLAFVCIGYFYSTVFAQKQTGKSEWVYPDQQGKLAYKTLEGGDKIMDFSHAGYMGGGVKIPSVEVKVTLSPIAGDNTDAIQNAIEQVSKMTLAKGFRGAILLGPGT